MLVFLSQAVSLQTLTGGNVHLQDYRARGLARTWTSAHVDLN